jgi:tetratricopeptide (TPR) repeat protein
MAAPLIALADNPSAEAVAEVEPAERLVDPVVYQPSRTELVEKQTQAVENLESRFGPYDISLKEALKSLGYQLKQSGDFAAAREAYKRALHVSRINEGLYNESQLSIVERLIDVELQLARWEDVDNHYAYLEHLYRKLYKLDDPRLEEGLRKVVAWHIDASNFNLNGDRIEHMRKVHGLMKLRLQVAELTLSGEDPLFDSLRRGIARSEYYLYLNSDISREMYRERSRQRRDRYLANRE